MKFSLLLIMGVGMASALASESPKQSKNFTNSVGMEFILTPAGSMKPFYIGKYEVTQAQWEAVMGSDSNALPKSNPFFKMPGMEKRIRNPKSPANMSWNDAQEFVKKLNLKEGTDKYRLPTEAEWEYAARAGTTTAYSFGESDKELKDHAWFGEDFATGSSHPVGLKKPNPWGLYDVHGNVWEWTQDRFSPGSTGRVVKGGSWHVTSDSWRTDFRKEYDPDYRGISIGIRLIKNAD